ncbi:hypothetical protein GN244_ATG16132 [Phytophthora infestans]|uniref:Uncharacterized protein n=1 Tax=Phytophthora infestans TaxID=4787 RepID=A0A833STS5_PHYIN|nr:hypothetical protein GN244_ATG16132 [Phytophthora infestans]
MGTLLLATEGHLDVEQGEVRSGRTRAKRGNIKRKRQWTERRGDGFEIVGSVQGKSRSPEGQTVTARDTLGSSV